MAAPSISTVTATPNPFQANAVIRYHLSRRAAVDLDIYEPTGRMVRALEAASIKGAGEHRAVWNGRNAQGARLPAGVYFYRLQAEERVSTGRMVLTK
jgi:flagellar hook assembly protein FlgD